MNADLENAPPTAPSMSASRKTWDATPMNDMKLEPADKKHLAVHV